MHTSVQYVLKPILFHNSNDSNNKDFDYTEELTELGNYLTNHNIIQYQSKKLHIIWYTIIDILKLAILRGTTIKEYLL